MPESIGFWIQLFVYGISFGSFAGVVITKLNILEKIQDEQKGLIERMVVVEQATKTAHHRINNIENKERK